MMIFGFGIDHFLMDLVHQERIIAHPHELSNQASLRTPLSTLTQIFVIGLELCHKALEKRPKMMHHQGYLVASTTLATF